MFRDIRFPTASYAFKVMETYTQCASAREVAGDAASGVAPCTSHPLHNKSVSLSILPPPLTHAPHPGQLQAKGERFPLPSPALQRSQGWRLKARCPHSSWSRGSLQSTAYGVPVMCLRHKGSDQPPALGHLKQFWGFLSNSSTVFPFVLWIFPQQEHAATISTYSLAPSPCTWRYTKQ